MLSVSFVSNRRVCSDIKPTGVTRASELIGLETEGVLRRMVADESSLLCAPILPGFFFHPVSANAPVGSSLSGLFA